MSEIGNLLIKDVFFDVVHLHNVWLQRYTFHLSRQGKALIPPPFDNRARGYY